MLWSPVRDAVLVATKKYNIPLSPVRDAVLVVVTGVITPAK